MSELSQNLVHFKPFRIAVMAVLSILALFLLVLTLHTMKTFGRYPGQPMNTITVQGTGEASAVPDIAQISYTVVETASSVEAAQDSATKRTDASLEALAKLGIDDKDVKTLGYNVNAQYDNQYPCYGGACPVRAGAPKIVGYQVSQSIEVKVRDTAKAGDVLAALGGLGVQNISGPNFMVDDEAKVSAEAREEAIDDAREKAEKLAHDLGVHLGAVVSYAEGGSYPMPMYSAKGGVMMDAAVANAPSLPVGENETTITVSVTYEIR